MYPIATFLSSDTSILKPLQLPARQRPVLPVDLLDRPAARLRDCMPRLQALSSGYWVRTQVGRKAEIFNSSTLATAVTDIPGDYSDGVLNYPFQAIVLFAKTADKAKA